MERFFIFLAFTIASYSTVYCQDDSRWFWRVHWENDFPKHDRYYTNGLRIDISDNATGFGYFIAQNIYTPESITIPDAQLNDRPYSGWLSVGITDQYMPDPSTIQMWELSIGTIGKWSFAKEVQTEFHRIKNLDKPQGWDNQIRNEYTLQCKCGQRNELLKSPTLGNQSLDFINGWFGYSVMVGNVMDYVEGELLWRISIPNSMSHDAPLPYDHITSMMPRNILSPNDTSRIKDSDRLTQVKSHMSLGITDSYLFARLKARAVVYNGMIQGGLINEHILNNKSPVTQDIKHLVLDLQVGAMITPGKGQILQLSHIWRTKEVRTQIPNKFLIWHNYSELQYSSNVHSVIGFLALAAIISLGFKI